MFSSLPLQMAYFPFDQLDTISPRPLLVIAGSKADTLFWSQEVEALRKSGAEVEYHKCKSLGHGFGLGTGTSAEGWVIEAIRFWERSIRRDSSKPRES